jgi:hypothetical protein
MDKDIEKYVASLYHEREIPFGKCGVELDR